MKSTLFVLTTLFSAMALAATAGTFDDYDIDNSGTLDRDEVANEAYLEDNFRALDINKDGLLAEDEIRDAWFQIDADLFDTWDTDENGRLDQNEVMDRDYIHGNFDTWDTNGNGFIEPDEADDGWRDADAPVTGGQK